MAASSVKLDLDAPVPHTVNDARVSAVHTSPLHGGRTDPASDGDALGRSHHWTLIGSVKQVADELESWFLEGAADGFNVLPSDMPGAVNTLVDKLVPELQRRGLFHTEYEGTTLRENLGLGRPADLSKRGHAHSSSLA